MEVSILTANQRISESAKICLGLLCKIVLCGFLFENCSTFTPPAKYEEIKKVTEPSAEWYHYEATRRGTYVFRNTDTVKICAEPFPDAAKDILASVKFTPETVSAMSIGGATLTNTKKVSTETSLNEKTIGD